MFSMLKMEYLRILKSKTFYASIFLFMLLMAICMYAQNDAQILAGYQEVPTIHEVGMSISMDYLLVSPLHFIYGFGAKYILLIFGIFFVSFVCNEYDSGFIKNSCMMYKNRNMIVINKLFIAIGLSLFTVILAFFSTVLFGSLLVEGFTIEVSISLFSYLSILGIVNIAYFTLLLCLCTITRNKVIGIIVAIVFTFGLTDVLLQTVVGDSQILLYSLSHITMTLPMYYEATQSLRAILMAGIFIIVYMTLSVWIIRKKDM